MQKAKLQCTNSLEKSLIWKIMKDQGIQAICSLDIKSMNMRGMDRRLSQRSLILRKDLNRS